MSKLSQWEEKGGFNMKLLKCEIIYLLLKENLTVQPKLASNSQSFLFDFPSAEIPGKDHHLSPRYRVVTAHITLMGFGETKWEKTAGCVSKIECASHPFNFLSIVCQGA